MMNFSRSPEALYVAQFAFESFVENCGDIPEQGFEYLSKLQHSVYNAKVMNMLRQNLGPVHRLNSYLQLAEEVGLHPDEKDKVLGCSKIYNAWVSFPKY